MKKNTFLQISKKIAIIIGIFLIPAVHAQSSLGYGPRAKSMAGAGTAMIESSIWGNSNPGAQVFLGQNLGIGIELQMPQSQYLIIGEPTVFEPGLSSLWPLGLEPGQVEGKKKILIIPQVAFNTKIDENNTIGVSIYANPPKGNEYETKTYYSRVIADFGSGEGFINPMGTVTSPTFFRFNQYFASISYSRKINDKLGIGLSAVGGWQSLNIGGLEAFGSLHYSEFPQELSTNGSANAYGIGGKIGLQWNISEKIQAGVAFRSKIYMSRFEAYKGFISESGKLDTPSEWSLGLVYKPFERFLMALDVNRICYSGVPAWGLAMKQEGTVSLGGENGGGFGRKDQMNYKFGVQYRIPKWQFRAGYQHSDVVLVAPEFLLNLLMPDVISDYISLGFSREIAKQWVSLAVVKGLKNTLTGLNGLDSQQYIELSAESWLIEIAVEF